MKKLIPFFIIFVLSILGFSLLQKIQLKTENIKTSNFFAETKKTELKKPDPAKILDNNYHIFQSFNNCGPAALSMALSYFGVNESQEKLGQALRPYQISSGDNDDKSVTLEELAEKSKEYGFIPYHRPNGNSEKIKLFITHNIPVIARTWLKENDDIGHYRIIKGYDENSIIQDDSFQGKNIKYSEKEFYNLWEKYNFEYLAIVPKDKKEIAEAILKEDKEPKRAWEKAAKNAEQKIKNGANESIWRFNWSIALHNIGKFQESVREFEKVENKLNKRALWYQLEPIHAYYKLGNYERVFEISDRILNNQNRAYSELYILRGKSFEKLGQKEKASDEYNKARIYNKNLKF